MIQNGEIEHVLIEGFVVGSAIDFAALSLLTHVSHFPGDPGAVILPPTRTVTVMPDMTDLQTELMAIVQVGNPSFTFDEIAGMPPLELLARFNAVIFSGAAESESENVTVDERETYKSHVEFFEQKAIEYHTQAEEIARKLDRLRIKFREQRRRKIESKLASAPKREWTEPLPCMFTRYWD
jgi:hypothetical protein